MTIFPGGKAGEKNGETEFNNILLKSMSNIWSKQASVQVFDFKTFTLKKYVNMFEHIEISETIYEGVIEPSY